MEFHLNRQLRFHAVPEHKSFYRWAINELDEQGQVVGYDQIPWGWPLYFTARELILADELGVISGAEFEGHFQQIAGIRQQRTIRAKLLPGSPGDDDNWRRQTTYRMFGTDRVISDFRLDVRPLESEDDVEHCRAWGAVSYTSETDFRQVTQEDCVQFYLMVKPSTFEHYAQRITSGNAHEVIFGAGLVTGFYSDWSPSISTRDVKVLTSGDEQKLELPEGLTVPRLGGVGEAKLYINSVTTPQITSQQRARDMVLEDEKAALVTAPPAVAETAAPGIDPDTLKLLLSLKSSARWIVGLLVALLAATLLKR
ncbi:hypothetical protein [Rhizobium sp. CCGE 510]|uniref:hypothetical protein n=1 Tax=Rhizobium sp. CCGE 510 TaxID=1132836 RepID=UPI00027B7BD8|nr:hypothetical protein [Rhizobium sp. CCGE 510]EJT03841.1 hypothetical protein RCCGE510_18146 [Rhizobium sp. CCGE 510]